jgi:hypothetical protein
MAIKIPKIQKCEVLQCSYNMDKQCCTPAITVGREHPACDTFFQSSQKGGLKNMIGSVGACKESDCFFNKSLECSASGIDVGLHENHADCITFRPRQL